MECSNDAVDLFRRRGLLLSGIWDPDYGDEALRLFQEVNAKTDKLVKEKQGLKL